LNKKRNSTNYNKRVPGNLFFAGQILININKGDFFSMFKGKKHKTTSKPGAQNKEEQAAIQNPDNPELSTKYKGKQGK